jgi:hypothetical protein
LSPNPNKLVSFKYALIWALGYTQQTRQDFQGRINKHIDKCGFTKDQAELVLGTTLHTPLKSMTMSAIEEKLKEAQNHGATLVILVLKVYDVAAYANFKNLTDRTLGMHSICMTLKRGRDDMTINVMMKVNLNLTDISHGLGAMRHHLTKTMVIGADLIHPGPGSYPGTPSIAAVVGSIDPFEGTCLESCACETSTKLTEKYVHRRSDYVLANISGSWTRSPRAMVIGD